MKYHTIGAKLILSFACSTLLLAIVSLVAWTTWNKLDKHVNTLLEDSVPKYNISFQLESRSAQVQDLLNRILLSANKTELNRLKIAINNEFSAMKKAFKQLSQKSELTLFSARHHQLTTSMNDACHLLVKRIDKQRKINQLNERLTWLHQDIIDELYPLRQEIQWQITNSDNVTSSSELIDIFSQIQQIIEQETTVFGVIQDTMSLQRANQLNNTFNVLDYRLTELLKISKPLYALPSSITYQQLLEELSRIVEPNGELHSLLLQQLTTNTQIEHAINHINHTLAEQHHQVAELSNKTTQTFLQTKKDTTFLISYGNHLLLVCFSISILTSLFLTTYFVRKHIVGRLNQLSNSLDAVSKGKLDEPILIDGQDEIARLSRHLNVFCHQMKEMERSNALNLMNNTQASIITCDENGTIESINRSAQQLFNLNLSTPTTLWQTIESASDTHNNEALTLSAPSCHHEGKSITLVLKSGRYVRLDVHPFTQNRHNKLIVTIHDITEQMSANQLLAQKVKEKTQSLSLANTELLQEIEERKKTEAYLKNTQDDLLQAAKMAVVGQTMTSMAHELNQPLSAMNTYLFSANLALDQKKYSMLPNSLHKIEELSLRMGEIINNLRHFAKKNNANSPLTSVKLHQVIEQAITIVSARSKQLQVTINNNIDTQLMTLGDDIQLEQVIINLLVNAMDAVAQHPARVITIDSESHESSWFRLMVSDTGNGIEADVIHKLFTPFTTTKAVGLGLGLTISRSILDRFNGSILLASTLSGGAMIVLELPKNAI